jgi:hypothetical protein
MEQMLLLMLEQRSAGTVHDALWSASGARGIQNVQRMIEGHLRKPQRGSTSAKFVKPYCPRFRIAKACEVRLGIHVGNDDYPLDAWDFRQQLGD